VGSTLIQSVDQSLIPTSGSCSRGRAPRIAADCSVDGYFDDTLDFRLLKPAVAMPGNAVQPPFGASNPSGRMEVPLSLEGGVLTVPVEINGAITLDFVIDSGAADVNVPADVVSTLIRTRTIRPSDFIAQQTYILADGTEAPSPVFIIRSLKVGGRVVPNVKCSIGSPKSSLLLGQSFLQNFRSWSIDNGRRALALEW